MSLFYLQLKKMKLTLIDRIAIVGVGIVVNDDGKYKVIKHPYRINIDETTLIHTPSDDEVFIEISLLVHVL